MAPLISGCAVITLNNMLSWVAAYSRSWLVRTLPCWWCLSALRAAAPCFYIPARCLRDALPSKSVLFCCR